MKKLRLLLLMAYMYMASTSFVTAQVSPELAPIEGAKSQTEANTAMIIKSWDQNSQLYNEALFKYNALRGTFSETINYMNYYYGLSKKKQKKEISACKAKIVSLLDETNSYNTYLKDNNTEAANARGGAIAAALAIKSGMEIADQIMDYIDETKTKKRESIKSDLEPLLLKSLDDYNVE
jgi:HD-GYP domain-containing protein (c-di-GMP phosphodiesterase class II)